LEYYTGILFLTTNRTGVIDEAFKSRMHLYLRYPSINLESTKLIWGKLLDRVMRDNRDNDIKVEFDRRSLMAYAVQHYEDQERTRTTWNARQIRNAFQTALAIGQYERVRLLADNDVAEDEARRRGGQYMRVELTKTNFDKIATTTRDFDLYMNTVRGGDDAQKAREERLRDEDFNPDGSASAKTKNYGKLADLRKL
jgi:hypothetical protein